MLLDSPLGDVLGTSWGRPESTSQEGPWNVKLGRPLDVRSARPRDVRSRRPWGGQIGSSGDALGTLDRDVLGLSRAPIFAGWESTPSNFNFPVVQFSSGSACVVMQLLNNT